MHYDYTAAKDFCEHIGLKWLGEAWVVDADKEASRLNFTQEQVDASMFQHLWQVKILFMPSTYSYWHRVLLAVHFLVGK